MVAGSSEKMRMKKIRRKKRDASRSEVGELAPCQGNMNLMSKGNSRRNSVAAFATLARGVRKHKDQLRQRRPVRQVSILRKGGTGYGVNKYGRQYEKTTEECMAREKGGSVGTRLKIDGIDLSKRSLQPKQKSEEERVLKQS